MLKRRSGPVRFNSTVNEPVADARTQADIRIRLIRAEVEATRTALETERCELESLRASVGQELAYEKQRQDELVRARQVLDSEFAHVQSVQNNRLRACRSEYQALIQSIESKCVLQSRVLRYLTSELDALERHRQGLATTQSEVNCEVRRLQSLFPGGVRNLLSGGRILQAFHLGWAKAYEFAYEFITKQYEGAVTREVERARMEERARYDHALKSHQSHQKRGEGRSIEQEARP